MSGRDETIVVPNVAGRNFVVRATLPYRSRPDEVREFDVMSSEVTEPQSMRGFITWSVRERPSVGRRSLTTHYDGACFHPSIDDAWLGIVRMISDRYTKWRRRSLRIEIAAPSDGFKMYGIG